MENKNEDTSVVNFTGDGSSLPSLGVVSPDEFDPQALSLEPIPVEVTSTQPVVPSKKSALSAPWVKRTALGLLGVALLLGLVWILTGSARRQTANLSASNPASQYNTVDIPLGPLSASGIDFSQVQTVGINGTLDVNGALIVSPSLQPASPKPGQIYYDKNTNLLAYYNGSQFIAIPSSDQKVVQSVGGLDGQITLGAGLVAVGGQLGNTGVLSVQGLTGNVSLSAGSGISINGTTITNSGIVSVTSSTPALTVSNDGNGNITLSGSGSGTVSSVGGTAGQLAKFTGAQTIGDSLISESGTTVTVSGDLSVVTGGLSLTNALTVSNGGTGATSLAANGVIIGHGTSALTSVTAGGAGLCFVSTVGAPTFAACPSASGVTSLNSLTGAISIANASGAGSTITIDNATTGAKGIASFNATNFNVSSGSVNTVQDINTTATPTFGRLTVTSSQAGSAMLVVNNTNLGATGSLLDLQLNGSSKFSVQPNGNVSTSGTINGQTISASASFTGTINVASNTVVGGTLSANGGTINASGALSISPSGTLTAGTSSQTLTLQGNGSSTLAATSGGNTTTLSFQAPGANVTYRVPTAAAGTYDFCTTAANCAGVGGSVSTAGGTINRLSKFTGSQVIGDSTISDNGSTVTTTANLVVQGGSATVGVANSQTGSLVLAYGSANFSGTLTQGALTGARTYTLPDSSGTVCLSSGNCLGGGGGGANTALSNLSSVAINTSLLPGGTGIDLGSGTAPFQELYLAGTSVSPGTNNFKFTGASTGGTRTITIPDASGTICLNNSTNCGFLTGSGTAFVQNGNNLGATAVLGTTDNFGLDIITNGTARLSFGAAGAASFSGTVAVNGGTLSSSGALSITPSGALTVGATGQALTLQGNASTTLTATGGGFTTTVGFNGAPTAAVTYNFDRTVAAGTYTICSTVGNCAGTGTGVTTAGGTAGTIAVFTASQAIGNSFLSQSGSTVAASANLNLTSGHTYQINGAQISSADLSNDSNLAKLSASQTFTGATNSFKNGADSTNAFNIQNAAASRLLTADTTNGTIILGTGSALDGKLVFNNVTNNNTITVVPAMATGPRTITLPNDSGTVCLDTGNCAGAGATLQTAYNFSVGGTTPKIKVNSTLNGVDIQDADTTIGVDLFDVRASNGAGLGSVLFGVGNTGRVTLQNSANSTTAFNVLTQGGTSVLTTDTTNGTLILGQGGTLAGKLLLHNGTNGNIGTLQTDVLLGQSTVYHLPDPVAANADICLSTGNCLGGSSGGANTALSNLSSVAINTALLPGSAGAIDLGSGTKPFGDIYLAGTSGTPGTNNFRITGASTSGTRIITLPDAAGTVCLQGATACGFAPSSGSANYIQNQNALSQSADFRINGTGRADTALQTVLLDTPSAVALDIGTSNATVINLKQSTTISGVLTMAGGQSTGDILTVSGSSPTSLNLKSGNNTAANGTGSALTIKSGDATNGTCTTACIGGAITIQGGSATGGSGTRNGGDVNIDAGTGASSYGSINIGATSGLVNIGTTALAASVRLQAGGGSIRIGDDNPASTVYIGNTNSSNTSTVNIGSNAGSGQAIINVGSTTASSYILLKAGSGANGITLNVAGTNMIQANTTSGISMFTNAQTGIALTGATPAGVSGNGSNEGTFFSLAAPTGGATTGTSANTGGSGGILSITSGTGGAATGASGANTGGAAGGITLQGGTGGAVSSTTNGATGGAGAVVTIQAGTGGAATGASGNTVAGAAGTISLVGGTGGAISSATGTAAAGGAVSIQGGTGGAGTGSSANSNGGAVTIQGGAAGTGGGGVAGTAGGVNIATTGLANTVQIGNTTGAVVQVINIGNNTTGSSTNNINIGSIVAGTTAIAGTTTITGRTSGSATTVTVNNNTSTGSVAVFQSASTAVFTIGSTGSITAANRTNSATAFQVQNATAADTLFTIDTSARSTSGGNLVKIGNSTGSDVDLTILQLDATNTAGIPSTGLASGALNGGLFYNNQTHKVSLIENGQIKIICNTTDLGCGTGTVTLQNAYNNSAGAAPSILTTSANAALTVQTAIASGIASGNELFGVRDANTGNAIGNSLFTVNSTGVGINIGGTGNPATTADLSFGNGANRTINVIQSGAGTAGKNLTISAGQSGTGSVSGGLLTLQGGGAASTTGTNGGVTIDTGTGATTANGTINIGTGTSNASAINIGNTSAASALTLQAGSGNINLAAATTQFTESASARILGVQTRSSNAAGTGLTIQGGAGGSGASANAGGDLKLIAGAGGGTNGNGGTAYLYGGAKNGSGTDGNVVLAHNGSSAIGKVGIGTNAPARTLDINFSNSLIDSPALRLLQSGTGDASIEFNTSPVGNNFYLGQDASDNGAFKINSSNAASSHNTPTHVQSIGLTSSPQSTTISQAMASTSAGNLVVAAVSWDTSAGSILTMACSDTQGNSYTNLTLYEDTTNHQALQLCYAKNIIGGANTVTATFNNGIGSGVFFRKLIASEYSGVATVNPVDGATGQYISSGTTSTDGVTSGTVTTTQDGDLIYGAVVDTNSSNNINGGTGFSYRQEYPTGANNEIANEDKVQASLGSVGATFTFGTAHEYVAAMVAFKAGTGSLTDTFTNSIFTLAQSGAAKFMNVDDSTTGFQVLNSGGTPLFVVDTTNSYVYVGNPTADSSAAVLVLDTKNTSGDPSTVVNGGMYYNSAINTMRCGQGGIWVSCIGGLLSSNTAASSAISNTASETNFSLTYGLPANYCVQGRVIRWVAQGVYSTTGTPTLTFKLKAGSTALATSPAITTGTGASNREWRIDGQTICNAAPGATAATETQGIATLFTAASTSIQNELVNTGTTNIATNGALTLQISATWSAASSSNTVTMRQFLIEGIGP